jgi:hypothetical protein
VEPLVLDRLAGRVGFAIDVGPADHLDPEYAEHERILLDRLAENPGRPLVLAVGSSRTVFGLHAARLSTGACDPPATVFNFALKGAGPGLERLVLRRLADRGVRPDLLFVEVLPPLFNTPNGPHVEAFWLKGIDWQPRSWRRLLRGTRAAPGF